MKTTSFVARKPVLASIGVVIVVAGVIGACRFGQFDAVAASPEGPRVVHCLDSRTGQSWDSTTSSAWSYDGSQSVASYVSQDGKRLFVSPGSECTVVSQRASSSP